MLLKLCVIAGAVAVGGVVLGSWLDPAQGAPPVGDAREFVGSAVYEPVARAASQAAGAASAEAAKVQDALSGMDPVGAIKNVVSSAFG